MKATLHSANRELQPGKTLLIAGDGRTLPADLAEFRSWGVPHDVGAIGRSIKLCPESTHWFNADGETAIAWAKQITAITHTMGKVDGFDADWDVEQPDYHYAEITNERGRSHGSSALFATLAGLSMGYEKIVLAGCPLDAEGHWYFEPTKETLGPLWLGVDFMAWLDFAKTEGAKQVRSMSGYTAQIVGMATREWV